MVYCHFKSNDVLYDIFTLVLDIAHLLPFV